MNSDELVSALLEFDWHKNAKLLVYSPEKGSYRFYRNGKYAGVIANVFPWHGNEAYVKGFGTDMSVQKSGLGRAMMTHVLEDTSYDTYALDSSKEGLAFYASLGFRRTRGVRMVLKRSEFKPSTIKFEEISAKEDADLRRKSERQTLDIGRVKVPYF